MQTGEQIQSDLLTWGGYAVGIIGALQAHGVELPHGSVVRALLSDPVFLTTAAVGLSSLIVRVRRSRLTRTAGTVLDGVEAIVEARVREAVAEATRRAARPPEWRDQFQAGGSHDLPGPPG